ncbi:MAG: hypothetical protein KGJ86_17715, partial [Chloroflexota bacterium]|nr:hypothetical protein [Chloroflexota bacterium]
LRHPFEPVVYRLALPVRGAEIDWTVYSPEGERKLREALVASPDDPDSIGPVFVLSVQRNLCQRGCSASIAG